MVKGDIKDRKGEKHMTNEGYEVEIIKCTTNKNCDVLFSNGYVSKNREYKCIQQGRIKNPYYTSVYGVGYFGEGNHFSKLDGVKTKSYQTWVSMLSRCYDEKFQERHPTYIGCRVDEHWHNFQNFAQWFESRYKDGFELDKDILVKGNKIYSPKTCCLIPQKINRLFSRTAKSDITPSVGVDKHYNRFVVRVIFNGERVVVGSFETEEEASKNYILHKEMEIKRVAKEWENDLEDNVYKTLISYKL